MIFETKKKFYKKLSTKFKVSLCITNIQNIHTGMAIMIKDINCLAKVKDLLP